MKRTIEQLNEIFKNNRELVDNKNTPRGIDLTAYDIMIILEEPGEREMRVSPGYDFPQELYEALDQVSEEGLVMQDPDDEDLAQFNDHQSAIKESKVITSIKSGKIDGDCYVLVFLNGLDMHLNFEY